MTDGNPRVSGWAIPEGNIRYPETEQTEDRLEASEQRRCLPCKHSRSTTVFLTGRR